MRQCCGARKSQFLIVRGVLWAVLQYTALVVRHAVAPVLVHKSRDVICRAAVIEGRFCHGFGLGDGERHQNPASTRTS